MHACTCCSWHYWIFNQIHNYIEDTWVLLAAAHVGTVGAMHSAGWLHRAAAFTLRRRTDHVRPSAGTRFSFTVSPILITYLLTSHFIEYLHTDMTDTGLACCFHKKCILLGCGYRYCVCVVLNRSKIVWELCRCKLDVLYYDCTKKFLSNIMLLESSASSYTIIKYTSNICFMFRYYLQYWTLRWRQNWTCFRSVFFLGKLYFHTLSWAYLCRPLPCHLN